MTETPVGIANRYFELYNTQQFDEIAKIVSDDIEVTHYNRGFHVQGRDQLLGLYEAANSMLGDRGFSNRLATTTDGKKVILQHYFSGKNLVDTPFGPAGSDYGLDLCTILTIEDGLITKYEDYG